MTTALDYPPAYVAPAYAWEPPGRRGSLGPEIVDFSASIGHPVDQEQADAIDSFAALGPGGKYLAFETCMIEGRQNGKTDRVVLPQTMFDFFVLKVEFITWTAHLMDTTLATFRTVKRLIEENPMLSRRVKEINESQSQQGVVLMSGAEWEFRSRIAGRGRTGDIWVADEALILDDEQVSARMPTLRSRPNPQVRYASSAGLEKSKVLRKLVRRGRRGGDPRLIFREFCAPGSFAEPGCLTPNCRHGEGTPGCTLDREELWHLASHAMGRRISYAVMRSERGAMPVVGFARELLGWHEGGVDDDEAISAEDWEATRLDELERARRGDPGGRPVFVLDVDPDMRTAAIAAGSFYGAVPHVELAGCQYGTDWVVKRLKELKKAHPGAKFGADITAGAKSLIPAIEKAGLTVEPLNQDEMCSAAAHMAKLSLDHSWTHTVDAVLDQAFRLAVKRTVGEGRWDWGRKKTDGDITPLKATSGALWLLEKHGAKTYDPLKSIY